jgi:hypothetical protein
MWNSQFTPLPVLSKPIDLKSRHFEETPLAHRAASVKKGPKQPFAAISINDCFSPMPKVEILRQEVRELDHAP